MGNQCCAADQSQDKKYELGSPRNQLHFHEESSTDLTSGDDLAENPALRHSRAQELLKKKMKNFSDKYCRGKRVGDGPFGQVYQCWLREEDLD